MVKNGLSVYEHNALKDFIKENVKFVKDEDIDLCLNILDGLKSGKISSEKQIDISSVADADVEDDAFVNIVAYPDDLLYCIIDKCR